MKARRYFGRADEAFLIVEGNAVYVKGDKESKRSCFSKRRATSSLQERRRTAMRNKKRIGETQAQTQRGVVKRQSWITFLIDATDK